MLYAAHRDAESIELLVHEDAGILARRVTMFDDAPTVWQVESTQLFEAEPDPARPDQELPESAAVFLPLFASLGLDVVIEEGIVRAEVLGLEVARVVVAGDGAAGLGVGIGRFDREASAMMHAGESQSDTLAAAAATVREHRRGDASPHPLNRLARSRWLRSLALGDPTSIGAASLEPVAPPIPVTGLIENTPAAAVGVDPDGAELVVVFAAGVDLDLVPTAADVAVSHPGARVVLIAAERDLIEPQRRLAHRLRVPVELRAVDVPWTV